MRIDIAACALGLLAIPALPVRAEVRVEVTSGRIDIVARGASLSEVLDALAARSGMKVVYDGASPRELVTVSLAGRSAVETLHELLKERKLNYALAVEASGRVQTLVISTVGVPHLAKEPARRTEQNAGASPLLDLLERTRAGDDAPSAGDVLPPGLSEHSSAAEARAPVELPADSPLKLLLLLREQASRERRPAPPADKAVEHPRQ